MSEENTTRLNSRLQKTPIAIVGMASVFAEAKNLQSYWDNILNKIDCIIDVPENRWKIEDYYSADKTAEDKTYCKRGGFIPELDFNPMEFGLPPNILEITDVAQLLSLIVAKDVLEDAGIGPDSGYDPQRIGITLGVGGGQKLLAPLVSRLQYPVLKKVLTSSGVEEKDIDTIIEKFKKAYVGWEENSFPGMLGNVIAGRIANRFDFGGMNCVVDAACAGSLAATRMALSELLEGRSDVMITGGVCCDNSITMYMSFSKTPAFTDADCVQTFDEESRGMLVGEGLGMVALKRLEDAERDGDRIYSVIKGVGASSDGKFKSIYAPRPEGQAKALLQAYEDAGCDPQTVGLIEAHGTGTAAGDVAEFNGLRQAFDDGRDDKQYIALGSVKSQIGHTKAAAGTAGFIKASLALYHKVLPPTINVKNPNPKLGIDDSPFYINADTRPWIARPDGTPRRAGISAFGFGGTNFHYVLEEYKPKSEGAYRLQSVNQFVLLAATKASELKANCESAIAVLKGADAEKAHYELLRDNGLRDLPLGQPRVGFVTASASESIKALESILKGFASKPDAASWELPTGVYYREKGLETEGKVVSLFSGQGSQYVNMGSKLAINYPTVMQSIETMNGLFAEDGGSLTDALYPKPVFTEEAQKQLNVELQKTENAQPAIGVISSGLFDLFSKAGFTTDFVAGHSFGELTALWAAGVISEDDYYRLAKARGAAMAAPDDASFDAGAMIAVVGEVSDLDADLKGKEGVSIANYNSKNQVVVAGETDKINAVKLELEGKGYKVVSLPVSAAFHTSLVGHAQKPFADEIQKTKFSKPTVPVFANGTGVAYPSTPASIKKALKNHILEPVRFKESIENIYDAGGRVFVEFGPKNTLTKLVSNILGDQPHISIAVNANPKKDADVQLRQAVIQLAVAGISLSSIDPYEMEREDITLRKKSPLSLSLGGHHYVSDKTQKIYADALDDGHQVKGPVQEVKVIQQAAPAPVAKTVQQAKPVAQAKPAPKPVQQPAPAQVAPVQAATQKVAPTTQPVQTQTAVVNSVVSSQPVPNANLADSIGAGLESFYQNQNEILGVHQKYLESPQQYASAFENLMSQQLQLAAQGQKIPESVERSMMMFHSYQADTLRVHEQYLQNQTQNSTSALRMMKGQFQSAAGVVVGGVTEQVAPVQREPVQVQQAVVAPAPVAPVQVKHTPVQPVAAKVIVEKKVVRQSVAAPVVAPIVATPVVATPVVATPVVVAPTLDLAKINAVMLASVAEKTGYPQEMLELEMDMEADLGIDSIKRVEILGSVQDELPELPELNASDLAELRTLGEIVDYMQKQVPAASSAPVAAAVVSAAPTLDLAKINQVMMAAVAEKTGYPVEMLELEMDMEADLGIDSIKRVEILGAVQDELPELPELNASDLAELRTLGEIVDYMQKQVPAASSAPVAVVSAAPTLDFAKINQVMMAAVAEKTGYPVEMLELEMDMEADLGIDSIKRVEILGAVQDELPELPELNASDLAELRTLGEIVDYMQKQVPAASSAPVAVAVVSAAPTLDLAKINQVMMAAVADKTGYPEEMLELEMDMEADLGIDSIKRVEILGAVQDELPELPELNASDLAELRTLGEIVDYMQKQVPAASSAPVVAAVVSAAPTLDLAKINQVMMAAVAEKTGYPEEMLELEMDMEADLGIDSIKRVEILGAVQDELPELPELNASELSELRTLGEIVGYMQKQVSTDDASVSSQVAEQAAPTLDLNKINQVMMVAVAQKTGYPEEMLELEMDMEADLGIDSIKRVEILGAVQDELPELPELNASELSELRTLGEIVDYMKAQVSATNGATGSSASAAPTVAVNVSEVVDEKAPSSIAQVVALAAPDALQVDTPTENVALVVDDGSQITALLTKALEAKGWKPAVLRLPKAIVKPCASVAKSTPCVVMADTSETALVDSLTAIQKDVGNIGAVFALQPSIASTKNGVNYPEASKALMLNSFLLAKHLKVTLNTAAETGRSAFVSVVRMDGSLGYGVSNGEDLVQGGLFGLTKTLKLEWPNVHCRSIDIASSTKAEEATNAILAELYDVNSSLVEVGYNANGRVTLQTQEVDSYSLTAGNSISKDSVFLVSGGAKGVTTKCVEKLAARYQCKFILLGRSGFDSEEPQWVNDCLDEAELKKLAMQELIAQGEKPTPVKVSKLLRPVLSAREISQAIAAIEATGSQALYVSADVTDVDAMPGKLASAIEKFGSVTGIVHGAGVLADKYIEQKTVEDFNAVYSTKVQGLTALLNAVDVAKLTHLALFSSAAGYYGNEGQADYSVANEILNKTALSFKQQHPNCHVVSFNWGPWDGGMVTPELKKMFMAKNVYVIPLDAGSELFVNELSSATNDRLQIMVGNDMRADGGAPSNGSDAVNKGSSAVKKSMAHSL